MRVDQSEDEDECRAEPSNEVCEVCEVCPYLFSSIVSDIDVFDRVFKLLFIEQQVHATLKKSRETERRGGERGLIEESGTGRGD